MLNVDSWPILEFLLRRLTPPSFGAAKRASTEWRGLAALTAGTTLGTILGTCEIAKTHMRGQGMFPAKSTPLSNVTNMLDAQRQRFCFSCSSSRVT
jgi:hypothetical protein